MPSELIITVSALLVFLGVAGSVLPLLPGYPLILLGAFIYAWHKDFMVISWTHLSVLAGLTLLGQFLGYVSTAFGAKKFGASLWGMLGAFIGGTLGLFAGGIFGIIAGSFTGAVIFEFIKGRNLHASLKIGTGTLIGLLGGTIGKFVIALIMTGICIVQVLK